MPTYEFEGKTYEVPEGMPADDVVAIARGGQPASATPQDNATASDTSSSAASAGNPAYTPVEGTIDAAELQHSKDWLAASRVMYKKSSGQDWQGSDEDLAQTGVNSMGWFNYNLPAMGVDAAKLAQSSPEEKQAFLYLMQTYDHLGMSWGGTWRAVKGMALDPTTYVGLGTFGLGAAAGQATKLGSKQALKEMLRVGIQTGIEGAAQAAAQDSLRQTVEKEVGARKDFSYGELAGHAALGGAAGAVLGGVTSGAGTLLRKEEPWSQFAQRDARDAVSPQEGRVPPEATPTAPEAVKPAGEAPSSPAVETIPPVPEGHVRFFHGGAKDTIDYDKAWMTPQEDYARGYANKSEGGGHVFYRDIPKEDAHFAEGNGYDEINGVYQNHERESDGLKYHSPGKPSEEPEIVHTQEGKPSEVLPTGNTSGSANEIMEAIRTVAQDSGARIFPVTRAETTEAASKATALLSKVEPEQMAQVVEALRREAVTPEQQQLLHNTFKETGDRMAAETRDLYTQFSAATGQANAVLKEDLFKQLETAKRLRDNVLAGDKALSSMDGRVLGDRVGAFNTGERRDLSEENILAAHGVQWEEATPVQKAWAQDEYFKQYDEWVNKASQAQEVKEADNAIAKAYESGDTAEAIRLTGDKQAIVDAQVKRDMAESGVVNQAYSGFNKGLSYLNEYIISTVFTTSTLMVNTIPSFIKTVYRPALDFLVKGGPADYAAFRQMTTQYMVMAQSMGIAAQAAKAAFAYEKALLSEEPNRILEHQAMFGGFPGRALRVFPRLLGATDEFFSQMNYRGFVVSQAVSDAVERGMNRGMTGQALEDYIGRVAKEAEAHMFASRIDAPNVIGFLRDQGSGRGYKGEALNEWVKVQLDKNGDLFKVAKSQAGKSYSDDLLFKRRFSGENAPSRWAAIYEKFVNDNPIMRIVGQMFFRTPVRVFEEGFRLTAGLNLLAPNMLKDLRGLNGQARQVKAQGEMMLSYGIATWAITQYGEGRLTSSGPTDFKTRRGRENAGDWQPNSYRPGERGSPGTSYSFRNLDPFSTPLKIIANVMDRLQDLQYRKAQGEFTDHHEKEALAWSGVAVSSIASAIQDANLTDGADQIIKLLQAVGDPEHKDMTLQKFFASKAQLAVPNQINKVMQQGAPNMNDPTTVTQFLRARINPGDPKVPRQYDVLGNVRTVANPLGALDGINFASSEQLKRGHSEKELAVLKEVSNLEIASGQSFGVMPAKVTDYGLKGQDLRTMYGKDGKTCYDKLQEIYKGLPVTNQLYAALVANKGGSVGTREHIGTRVEIAKSIVKDMRDVALVKLLSKETGLKEEYIKSLRVEAEAVAGKHDVGFLPYR